MHTRHIAFYHPNGKGNGSALKVELHPATETEDGHIILSLVSQTSTGTEADIPTFPQFAWGSRNAVKLDLVEVEKMLEVFRGETESINDGKGLLWREDEGSAVFTLSHVVEPVWGYRLGIEVKGETLDKRSIFLSRTEGGALMDILTASMGLLAFGI